MKPSIILVFSLLVFLSFTSERPYPQDYFRVPVNGELRLSGTFGELRPNHFHSGIDIKGTVGIPLYAAADGFVSRIKVQGGGYGKVLYISHPNGYTTVYAHMDKFVPELESFIKSVQYSERSFEIERFPAKDRFYFKKGEKIGTMGITGNSFGPHLHFEIRDSRNQKPINPLLFGLRAADQRPPRFQLLKLYHLNPEHETNDTEVYGLLGSDGNYRTQGDTLLVGAWRIGVGLKVYDQLDELPNKNGPYSFALLVDDVPVYEFEMEAFAFAESRYLNAHLDYEAQVEGQGYINRLYRLPGNRLSLYKKKKEDGVIALTEHRAKKVEIVVKDLGGNTSKLQFWVKRKKVEPAKDRAPYNYVFPFDEENILRNASIRVRFPSGSFYENTYFFYEAANDQSDNVFSAVHHLHQHTTPVHRYFDIAIQPRSIPIDLMDKAFIAYCDKNNNVTNFGGEWKDGMVHGKARILGDFCIMIDNEAPTITPITFQNNMKGYNLMSFKIEDNFRTGGRARGLRYRGTIDGQWVLLTYDAKKNLLTHRFEEDLAAGQHQFRLVVTDDRGNEAVLERSFVH